MNAVSQFSTSDASRRTELNRQWNEDGFLRIKNVVPDDICKALRSDVAAAFTDGYSNAVGTGMGGVLSGHLNCFPGKRAKDLADHLDTIGLKVAIEELCGYKVVLTSVGCNTNIPGSKVQNFHIDREPEQPFIIINISLVDTDVTNGATEVAPGTSKIRLFYWEFLLSSHRRNRVRLTSRAG